MDDIEKKFADAIAGKNLNNDTVMWDSEQPQLMIKSNNQGTTFHAKYNLKGSWCYIFVGKFPEMTIESARIKTSEILAQAEADVDPYNSKLN